LRIAPVIPSDLTGFTATRKFRGVTYSVTVKRAGPGHEVTLTVDGRAVAGNIIPYDGSKSAVVVEATLR
jgi:cellobiose phosphorylase